MVVEIAGRKIGLGEPCFIIAEAGVNHNGDLETAKRLIDAAVETGADAVKFQTFQAKRLAAAVAPKARYQAQAAGDGESQRQMLERLELSFPEFEKLFAYCAGRKILFLSSPFDEESAAFLNTLGVAAFKIPSGELTNLPLISSLARCGKPMILSTGMATLAEVEETVTAIRSIGEARLILLHCVSSYPTDPKDANLRAMETLSCAFHLPVGFSDHTQGIHVSLAAVALGACVIEKHLTLDRALPGPDHHASLDPKEFALLVRGIREVEVALGDGRKEPRPCEKEIAAAGRKSLVARRRIEKGEAIHPEMLEAKRPGTGISPSLSALVVGKCAKVPIEMDTLISWEALGPGE